MEKIPKFFIQRPPKYTKVGIFGIKIYHLAIPGHLTLSCMTLKPKAGPCEIGSAAPGTKNTHDVIVINKY
jgi:hypothetical protein